MPVFHQNRRTRRLRKLKEPKSTVKQQALLPTRPPSSCPTTSLFSVGTPQWRSSMVLCICIRPSKSLMTFNLSQCCPASAQPTRFLGFFEAKWHLWLKTWDVALWCASWLSLPPWPAMTSWSSWHHLTTWWSTWRSYEIQPPISIWF